MKFIHIADVHLGARPDVGSAYSEVRPRELWEGLAGVIDLCEGEKTDVLLIAGDLFHRQPLLRELKEVNYLFSSLSHTQVVFMAGNHDYLKRDSYYRTFEWGGNVLPLLGREMGFVILNHLDLAVYGFSYYDREIREPRYDVKAPGKAAFEILLAHGGDESHVPVSREALGASGFDYIAMGHIHKPQVLVENAVAYAGAPEPVDKNDTGQHGYIRGEISEKGTRIEFVPFAKREYIHLALRVNESMTNGSVRNYLKETVEKRGVQNVYKFILRGLRDTDVVFDTGSMDVYGNIVEILDETQPAYDYKRLYEDNRDNVLGRFIELFQNCEEGSPEQQALQAGVGALLDNSFI